MHVFWVEAGVPGWMRSTDARPWREKGENPAVVVVVVALRGTPAVHFPRQSLLRLFTAQTSRWQPFVCFVFATVKRASTPVVFVWVLWGVEAGGGGTPITSLVVLAAFPQQPCMFMFRGELKGASVCVWQAAREPCRACPDMHEPFEAGLAGLGARAHSGCVHTKSNEPGLGVKQADLRPDRGRKRPL